MRPGGATETCSASFVLPQRLGVSAVETIPDSADSPGSPLSFHAWLKTRPSAWDWDLRHQLYLYEQLQKVTDGETKRLMIFMPPRHGKSEACDGPLRRLSAQAEPFDAGHHQQLQPEAPPTTFRERSAASSSTTPRR